MRMKKATYARWNRTNRQTGTRKRHRKAGGSGPKTAGRYIYLCCSLDSCTEIIKPTKASNIEHIVRKVACNATRIEAKKCMPKGVKSQ